MTWLFHKVIVLQIIKKPSQNLTRPSPDAFRPFGLISRACPVITKKQTAYLQQHGKCSIFLLLIPSIRMGSPHKSDSMRRARDVCEGISDWKILHFSYYCKYGVCFLVMAGQALLMSPKGRNASENGLVKFWEGFFIICNTITLFNNHVIRVNMNIKRKDYLYNSINRCMIRLCWSRAMFIEIRALNKSRLLSTLRVVHCMVRR